MLDEEALAEGHPAHGYVQRRFASARLNLAAAMRWHPDPDAAAVQVHSYLDGIQLDWLRDGELDLEELWSGYAAFLRRAWCDR